MPGDRSVGVEGSSLNDMTCGRDNCPAVDSDGTSNGFGRSRPSVLARGVICSERIEGQSLIIFCIGRNDDGEIMEGVVVEDWEDLSETVDSDSGAAIILKPAVELRPVCCI